MLTNKEMQMISDARESLDAIGIEESAPLPDLTPVSVPKSPSIEERVTALEQNVTALESRLSVIGHSNSAAISKILELLGKHLTIMDNLSAHTELVSERVDLCHKRINSMKSV